MFGGLSARSILCSLFFCGALKEDGPAVALGGLDLTLHKAQIDSYAGSLARAAEPARELENAIKAPLMSLCAR